jgi:hypothetical protein
MCLSIGDQLLIKAISFKNKEAKFYRDRRREGNYSAGPQSDNCYDIKELALNRLIDKGVAKYRETHTFPIGDLHLYQSGTKYFHSTIYPKCNIVRGTPWYLEMDADFKDTIDEGIADKILRSTGVYRELGAINADRRVRKQKERDKWEAIKKAFKPRLARAEKIGNPLILKRDSKGRVVELGRMSKLLDEEASAEWRNFLLEGEE